MNVPASYRALLLALPLLAAARAVAQDNSPPDASATAPAPSAPDDWENYLISPSTPTRPVPAPGQSTTTPYKDDIGPRISIAANRKLDTDAADNSTDDDRLAAIAQMDHDFFQTLRNNPDSIPPTERDSRAQTIYDKYSQYLDDHPNDVDALVLYGKFLRLAGMRDTAYVIFQRAHKLNPQIAVVDQQMGNYLAEEGNFTEALDCLRQASALAPAEPLYHYQIGELLNVYYDSFLGKQVFTEPALNRAITSEFSKAAELAPQEPGYAWRYAECFYDLRDPDWNAALAAWEMLSLRTTSPAAQEAIRLHRARALLELGRLAEARPLIEQPVHPVLEASRAELAQRLADATAAAATPSPTTPAAAAASPPAAALATPAPAPATTSTPAPAPAQSADAPKPAS